MVPNVTGAEHAVSTDLDPFGGDDGAAVQPGVTADADDRLGAGGDQAVHFGVRPGVDIRLDFHSPGTGDAKPAIPQQARSEVDIAPQPIRQRRQPPEGAGRRISPLHHLCDYPAAYDVRMTVISQSSGKWEGHDGDGG